MEPNTHNVQHLQRPLQRQQIEIPKAIVGWLDLYDNCWCWARITKKPRDEICPINFNYQLLVIIIFQTNVPFSLLIVSSVSHFHPNWTKTPLSGWLTAAWADSLRLGDDGLHIDRKFPLIKGNGLLGRHSDADDDAIPWWWWQENHGEDSRDRWGQVDGWRRRFLLLLATQRLLFVCVVVVCQTLLFLYRSELPGSLVLITFYYERLTDWLLMAKVDPSGCWRRRRRRRHLSIWGFHQSINQSGVSSDNYYAKWKPSSRWSPKLHKCIIVVELLTLFQYPHHYHQHHHRCCSSSSWLTDWLPKSILSLTLSNDSIDPKCLFLSKSTTDTDTFYTL